METTASPLQLIVSPTPPPPPRSKPYPSEFRAMRLRDLPFEKPLADTPTGIAQFWRAGIVSAPWYNPEVEQLCAVSLNSRRRVTGFWLVGQGTQDAVLTHPREVFRTAIMLSASAIILAHNHPSGDPGPSEADIKVSRELIRAGQLLKIDVLDHVIIGHPESAGGKGYTSLRELGYWY
jgi:hypothetical protein